MTLRPNGTNTMTSVVQNFTLTGTMNLSNNTFIDDYSGASPIGTIQALLTSGYNFGSWNGAGINTSAANASTALGFAESTDLFSSFPASFAGQSVNDTAVLIRYTLYGDATLNRTVDTIDFNILAVNFSQTGKTFSQGNFDYDALGNVDTIDFNLLAANFSKTLAPASAPAAKAAAPGLTDAIVSDQSQPTIAQLLFSDEVI